MTESMVSEHTGAVSVLLPADGGECVQALIGGVILKHDSHLFGTEPQFVSYGRLVSTHNEPPVYDCVEYCGVPPGASSP